MPRPRPLLLKLQFAIECLLSMFSIFASYAKSATLALCVGIGELATQSIFIKIVKIFWIFKIKF